MASGQRTEPLGLYHRRRRGTGSDGERVNPVVTIGVALGLSIAGFLTTSGEARANMRAPRAEAQMPSSALGPPKGDLQTRVLHEDLTFRCEQKTCRVTAVYLVEADRVAPVALDFILPVNARVTARVGQAPAPVALTRAEVTGSTINERLRLDQLYVVPDGRPMPPSYQATASVELRPGPNQITFEYDQPLGFLERDYGYFHKGRMVGHCLYVVWPLREWARAKDFAIDLRFEVDRPPPSWWKRTFGHPLNVSCDKVHGQRAQVAGQLIYTAKIGDPFPDYLDCEIGDDDLVHD